MYCKYTEMGFSVQKTDHVGRLSLTTRALSINLSFKNAGPFIEKKPEKNAGTIKIALDMLRHSQCGKREVWHALLNPAPLFAFDSKSHNDIQVLTKLRNEAATDGEKWR